MYLILALGTLFIIKKPGTTDRPSDKLDYPLTQRFFKILEEVQGGASYRLEVPDGWTMTNVFHVDRLRKYQNNPLPGQANEIPPGETINDKEELRLSRS